MARKRFKLTRGILFIWLFLAGLILFLSPQKITNKCQFVFTRIFQLPLKISRSISLSAQTNRNDSDVISRRKFIKLQNHLANLQAQLTQTEEKIDQVTGMKNRSGLEGAKILLADVITASLNSLHCEIIINRGQTDGLSTDMFVLGDNSIIGTISQLSERTAKVKLLTDPAFKLPIKVNGLKTNKILQGAGNNTAKIKLLQTKYKINVGDYVYACKKPGYLDQPMTIGKIKKYTRNEESSLLWDVTVEPACNIQNLNSVAVIIMNPQIQAR